MRHAMKRWIWSAFVVAGLLCLKNDVLPVECSRVYAAEIEEQGGNGTGEQGSNGFGEKDSTYPTWDDMIDMSQSTVSQKTAVSGDTITWRLKFKDELSNQKGYEVCLEYPGGYTESLSALIKEDNCLEVSYQVPDVAQSGTYRITEIGMGEYVDQLRRVHNITQRIYNSSKTPYDMQWENDHKYSDLDVQVTPSKEDNTLPVIDEDNVKIIREDGKLFVQVPITEENSVEMRMRYCYYDEQQKKWKEISIRPSSWKKDPGVLSCMLTSSVKESFTEEMAIRGIDVNSTLAIAEIIVTDEAKNEVSVSFLPENEENNPGTVRENLRFALSELEYIPQVDVEKIHVGWGNTGCTIFTPITKKDGIEKVTFWYGYYDEQQKKWVDLKTGGIASPNWLYLSEEDTLELMLGSDHSRIEKTAGVPEDCICAVVKLTVTDSEGNENTINFLPKEEENNLEAIPKRLWFIGKDVTEGDWTYQIVEYGSTVAITGYSGSDNVVEIPKTLQGMDVIAIGNKVFSESDITEIIIPQGVTHVGNQAFANCINLKSITLPDSVTTIQGTAFMGCSGLTSITLPDGLTTIEYSTFKDCNNLTSVTLPDGLTTIEFSAFEGCSSLTSVTLPDGVTTIGNSAFMGCSSLTSITIPHSVTEIGDYTFGGCSAILNVEENSYAQEYARSNYFEYQIVDISSGKENQDSSETNDTSTENSSNPSASIEPEDKKTSTGTVDAGNSKDSTNSSNMTNNETNNTTNGDNTTGSVTGSNTGSTQETVTTPSATVAKVTSLKVKNKKSKKVTVSFKKIKDAKYQVQYSTDKKFKKDNKTKTVSKNSVTISKLKKNKKYYFRVRAFKTVNEEKITGKWSSVKSVKIKK